MEDDYFETVSTLNFSDFRERTNGTYSNAKLVIDLNQSIDNFADTTTHRINASINWSEIVRNTTESAGFYEGIDTGLWNMLGSVGGGTLMKAIGKGFKDTDTIKVCGQECLKVDPKTVAIEPRRFHSGSGDFRSIVCEVPAFSFTEHLEKRYGSALRLNGSKLIVDPARYNQSLVREMVRPETCDVTVVAIDGCTSVRKNAWTYDTARTPVVLAAERTSEDILTFVGDEKFFRHHYKPRVFWNAGEECKNVRAIKRVSTDGFEGAFKDEVKGMKITVFT